MARQSTKLKTKKSLFKRIAIAVGKVLLWFFIFSLIWVLAYRFINPPITFLMVQRNWERKADGKPAKIKKEWVKFEEISDNMKRAAVSAEDQLFLKHMGFDIKAIEKAYESNLKKRRKR
ncbi:transglycosylase domain-containing protein [Pedobacter sp. SL55]|uniref:transglycosylase domain-containing protein n=1 Tax=Pedobacter sp. SL55 TaxID=2995161 RepID=UPI002D1E398E|nr:transglycosylase domain-containing protein [Pedobacter sp. SL55]